MPQCAPQLPPAAIYCNHCGYDLQGQTPEARRCPECGRRFHPASPGSFRKQPLPGGVWYLLRQAAKLLMGVAVVLGCLWGWFFWGWAAEQSALTDLVGWHIDEHLGGEQLQAIPGVAFWPLARVVSLETNSRDLEKLRNLRRLRELILANEVLSDEDLAPLRSLAQLRRLTLDRTLITDAGLVHLRELKELQGLSLNRTQVGDAGLAHLRNFPKLRYLDLDDTPVTDAGLSHLRDLAALEELSLTGTNISDAGLAQIKVHKRLKMLWLRGTRVTAGGVKDLQAALPGVRIYW